MINLLDRLSNWTARATDAVVILMTVVMMSALILQVFSRYVLSASLIWSEELALILFTWTTLLAATSVLRDMAHVRLDVVISYLPLGLQKFWNRVITIVIFLFCIALAVSGYDYTVSTMGQVSAAMRLPIEVLHLAAPVCGGLGALHAFARIFKPVVVTGKPKEFIG
ncbi:TRAP-type C4-dicarboxylate transport system, small permease component [Sulfitobacter brevis]|uniref:TRAP transporter small permease protein n=1 Tax=Sulfitobacter brevis TaxID=74348 RepID=A0A1I2BV48_9RHOB|nr:TRAP transporter small permease [Sulfitobacter brevis]SFE59951.1 TRAP-type C4-dicarboxylate transport system, small permease component [Sulfitobacter brevis]